jgi:hypothetical protein
LPNCRIFLAESLDKKMVDIDPMARTIEKRGCSALEISESFFREISEKGPASGCGRGARNDRLQYTGVAELVGRKRHHKSRQ